MTELPAWLDMLAAVLVVVGVVFALVGSLGLAKLSDFLKRLHGPTKASTLGVGCVLIASMLYFSARGERDAARTADHALRVPDRAGVGAPARQGGDAPRSRGSFPPTLRL